MGVGCVISRTTMRAIDERCVRARTLRPLSGRFTCPRLSPNCNGRGSFPGLRARVGGGLLRVRGAVGVHRFFTGLTARICPIPVPVWCVHRAGAVRVHCLYTEKA